MATNFDIDSRWMKGLALSGVGLLALTACSDDSGDGGSEVDTAISVDTDGIETINEGELLVCSDVPYAPFEYYSEDGDVVGFDIDVANTLAQAMDLEAEIVQTGFEGIQSGVALNAATCDLALSGMTITEERQGNMLFSDPYLDDNLGLLVRADSGIETLDDLDSYEGTVGVQSDTTGADEAQERGLETRDYVDSGLLIQGLESDQVGAAIGNISILGYHAGADEDLIFIEEIDTGEQLGVAAELGNDALIDAVNEILAEMESNGEMEELEERWFASDDTPDEAEDADAEAEDNDDEEDS